jgi:hypothetical protein
MRQELDEYLCKVYPKMMVNRNKDMKETCMCWGFEVGDGWFNIINQLMGNIQHHLDWKERQRDVTIRFNSTAAPEDIRPVPDAIPQVTLDQVKEKFGSLRFYITGGDEYISGMVTLAESMSGVTCEDCGSIGERRSGGWIRTLCDTHEAEAQAKMKERFGDE